MGCSTIVISTIQKWVSSTVEGVIFEKLFVIVETDIISLKPTAPNYVRIMFCSTLSTKKRPTLALLNYLKNNCRANYCRTSHHPQHKTGQNGKYVTAVITDETKVTNSGWKENLLKHDILGEKIIITYWLRLCPLKAVNFVSQKWLDILLTKSILDKFNFLVFQNKFIKLV